MVACEQLHIEICSHRGALSQDDSPKLLTSEGLNDLLGAGFRCEADLDLTREKESWIIGHPGDLSTLKSLGRDLSEALGFPQLLQTWQQHPSRLLALELKAEPVTATELEELLEQLTAQRLPNGSVGVWYLPQELGLFEQVHRDRYPGLLGIMAMFDRPWRGADVGSKESLDAAARAGIQVLGMSIRLSSELLSEASRRKFLVVAFGVNSEDRGMRSNRRVRCFLDGVDSKWQPKTRVHTPELTWACVGQVQTSCGTTPIL
ncbi:unnamed protein product [Effrenium voratum]|nr:unnamed protein product [Effrenium voratum]